MRAEPPVEWLLSEVTTGPGHPPQNRAIVYAPAAEAAIREVMRAVSAVGHIVNRYDEVAWTELEGKAYRL